MMHNDEFKLITEDMERLRNEVMSRVRTVRKIRAFLASPMSFAAVSLVSVLCASIFVSFADIIQNIMAYGHWSGRFSYTYEALMHARMTVQILALLTSISFLALFAKILFKLRTPVYSIGNFIASFSRLKFFRS